MRVIIVGGVAGGATAAARIRRLDEQAQIVIYEKTGFISYANCGLPYYIGGVIEDEEELTLQTPESFHNRFAVEVKTHHEVTAIHPEKQSVSVKNMETGEIFEDFYDRLLLATGARSVVPSLPGINSDRIFTLRTVEDTLRIHRYIEDQKPKSVVIVGGGYIGIEMAENFACRKMQVTIVQRPKQLMNTLDFDMASMVNAKLRSKGINLVLGGDVAGFAQGKNKIQVQLKDRETLYADMVLLAVGVRPDTSLAKDAGLTLGVKDSILVNDRMETSARNIYAVGDAVQVRHFVSEKNTTIALAGPANKQGRIAADNICGGNSHYRGSMGSSVIKIFDMTTASTGLTEKAAVDAGMNVDSVVLSPGSHAAYYPETSTMTMKVVFEKKTYRLLGAQIVGYEGVDKRLDVLATAIAANFSGCDLKDLDLCYAPPYSSAKDPVNMAGFIIDNIRSGLLKQYHYSDMEGILEKKNIVLLDTRTEEEYKRGHIDGFINIPVDELRQRINEIPVNHDIYVICQSGLRSYIACRILSQNGRNCYNFSGGYRFYDSVTRESNAAQYTFPCGMDKR